MEMFFSTNGMNQFQARHEQAETEHGMAIKPRQNPGFHCFAGCAQCAGPKLFRTLGE